MKPRLLALIVIATVMLASCGNATEEAKPTAPDPVGRQETRSIRNTDHLGYSGSALADKLDGALDLNDHRVEDLDRRLEEQTQAP